MGGGRKRVCEIERDTEKQKGMVREGERENRETEKGRHRETGRQREKQRQRQRRTVRVLKYKHILKLFRQKTIPTYYHS